jgi:hypothetical protein
LACLLIHSVWGPRESCVKTEEPRGANPRELIFGVTQTVMNRKKDTDKTPAKQGADAANSDANKLGASTPFDFDAKNLTAYGGLLPVATLLERLGFQQLVEETLTVKRVTRAMTMYQFVVAMVLAAYVGFSRLYHLRFVAREPMLTGILKVLRLPP